MKHIFKHSSVLVIVLLICSCNTFQKKESEVEEIKPSAESAIISFDTTEISITWIAYKFTNKTAVRGAFNQSKMTLQAKSGRIGDLLKASKISIPTKGVNSGDSIRDLKLKDIFFKRFNTDTILGEIKDAASGNGTLVLTMNNISNEIPYNYNLSQDTIAISSTLNLIKWKGEAAINTLNKACYDLHKGTDGISKLWPDVDIAIKIPTHKLE